MIEVRFSAATCADLHATMREYLGSDRVNATGPQPAVTLPDAQLTNVESNVAGVVVSNAAGVVVSNAAGAVPVPYATIADLIPKMVSKHGKPKVVALLETFGVKNGKELKTEQYGAFISKAHTELPLA